MKKIINNTQDVVREMCHGIVMANSDLAFDAESKVIYRKNIDKDKVALICGGGSGHEPAHAGYVGYGMLDAAVCGDVFASPSQIQVYRAIRRMQTDKGVLLVIKNYSGDVMNFKNAAYLAGEDGIDVDYVIVDDDIAVQDSLYTVGRRGVAGTVFVHKIAGAAAEMGKSLSEVKAVAEKVAANVKSIGFALTSCTVPAKGTPTFSLEDDEIEYGVGIHGEPGIQREKLSMADELAKRMTESILAELKIDGSKKERAAVLINGFGASPLMELYILNSAVARELNAKGVTVVKSFVGNYMTSLDMAGASVSVLKLDAETEELLNQPSDTMAFSVSGKTDDIEYFNPWEEAAAKDDAGEAVNKTEPSNIIGNKLTYANMLHVIEKMSESILKNEVPFCELDSHAGDGDFGMSVAKGFRELEKRWAKIAASTDDIGIMLQECSLVIMEHCGGASGPIWGSAFRAAGKATEGKKELSVPEFTEMMAAAVDGIQTTGERSFGRGAVVGDKTLIDALVPCADSWKLSTKAGTDFVSAFELGANAAIAGAKNTESIVARMGRAGTVGERSLGYPDAGAYALGVILTDITYSLVKA